jgi:hypothetical protein
MYLVIITLALISLTHALPIDLTPRAVQAALTKPPAWLNAAASTLVCYDMVLGGAFCCIWACGYFAWVRREETRENERTGILRGRRRALGEVPRSGRGRAGRETLVEAEMRTLGMI